MASKRTSQNTTTDDRASKRRQANSEEPQHHPPNRYLPFLSRNDITSYMEPVIRRVVQEELHHRLISRVGLTLNQPASICGGKRLQLCFKNKLPPTIFTQTNIRAERNEPLQIEMRDQQRVVRNESSSSMKIRICVLDGDFGSNGEDDWTTEQFKAKTAIPREGRGPLLIGDTVIKLENGVGYINKKIVFTDISRTGSRTFRLGLQIMEPNSIGAADIREGRSEPFRVLDHRGETYKKHDRPSLNDDVWRLRGIHKHGKIHKQLLLHGINTVEDFLQLNTTNQGSLQEKIGKTAGKYWKTIIAHAKDCDVDDDKRYIYFATDYSISLVFNSIYEILEVTFDHGQNYRSLQSLSSEETRLVERVKQVAYSNLKDLKPFDAATHVQYVGSDQVPQQFDIPIAQAPQGQNETLPSFSALGELLPYFSAGGQLISGAYTDVGESLFDAATHEQYDDGPDQVLQQFDIPIAQQDQTEPLPSFSALEEPLPYFSPRGQLISGGYTDVGDSQFDPIASYLHSPLNQCEQGNVNPFSFVYGDGAESSNHSSFPNSAMYICRGGKRKTVWHKIRTAFKCVILFSSC